MILFDRTRRAGQPLGICIEVCSCMEFGVSAKLFMDKCNIGEKREKDIIFVSYTSAAQGNKDLHDSSQ